MASAPPDLWNFRQVIFGNLLEDFELIDGAGGHASSVASAHLPGVEWPISHMFFPLAGCRRQVPQNDRQKATMCY